ncbi:hypothetical protein EVAR_43802_1 [Eumeta japonica]|uniref:Uncharacterized protein n=1 Tax=Eumeta variegata TaxID=151549 RepID=A0A4C1XTS5_EUMVA|nr:hypothetical protein EVAR_43802_1 [Eumeta japonica]
MWRCVSPRRAGRGRAGAAFAVRDVRNSCLVKMFSGNSHIAPLKRVAGRPIVPGNRKQVNLGSAFTRISIPDSVLTNRMRSGVPAARALRLTYVCRRRRIGLVFFPLSSEEWSSARCVGSRVGCGAAAATTACPRQAARPRAAARRPPPAAIENKLISLRRGRAEKKDLEINDFLNFIVVYRFSINCRSSAAYVTGFSRKRLLYGAACGRAGPMTPPAAAGGYGGISVDSGADE